MAIALDVAKLISVGCHLGSALFIGHMFFTLSVSFLFSALTCLTWFGENTTCRSRNTTRSRFGGSFLFPRRESRVSSAMLATLSFPIALRDWPCAGHWLKKEMIGSETDRSPVGPGGQEAAGPNSFHPLQELKIRDRSDGRNINTGLIFLIDLPTLCPSAEVPRQCLVLVGPGPCAPRSSIRGPRPVGGPAARAPRPTLSRVKTAKAIPARADLRAWAVTPVTLPWICSIAIRIGATARPSPSAPTRQRPGRLDRPDEGWLGWL